MAQLVKRPALDFGYPALDFNSVHDLIACGSEPCFGLCTDSAEPAWDSLSLPLSAPPALKINLKINLKTNQKNKEQTKNVKPLVKPTW